MDRISVLKPHRSVSGPIGPVVLRRIRPHSLHTPVLTSSKVMFGQISALTMATTKQKKITSFWALKTLERDSCWHARIHRAWL